MLDGYLHLLKNEPEEYTDEWKNEHLEQQIEIHGNIFDNSSDGEKDQENNDISGENENFSEDERVQSRAVDSHLVNGFTDQASKQSIARVLQIYGVDFFFRVHLRRYDFSYLSKIIESGKINKKSDLLKVKGMVKKLRDNVIQDKALEKYYDEIMSLDRIISQSILFSRS
jgi:hypothetical protein